MRPGLPWPVALPRAFLPSAVAPCMQLHVLPRIWHFSWIRSGLDTVGLASRFRLNGGCLGCVEKDPEAQSRLSGGWGGSLLENPPRASADKRQEGLLLSEPGLGKAETTFNTEGHTALPTTHPRRVTCPQLVLVPLTPEGPVFAS